MSTTPDSPGDDASRRPLESPDDTASGRGTRGDTNGLAVAGFVCSFCGLVLFWLVVPGWILGTLGIVFAAIGRRRAQREPRTGHKLATAGLIMGPLAFAATTALFVAALVSVLDEEADDTGSEDVQAAVGATSAPDASDSPGSAASAIDAEQQTADPEQHFTLAAGVDIRTFVIDHEGSGDVEVTLHDCHGAEMVVTGSAEKHSERNEEGELPRSMRLTAHEAHGSFVSVHKLGSRPAECSLRSNATLVDHIDEDGTELRLSSQGSAQFDGKFDYLTDPDVYTIELSRGDTIRMWVTSAEADTRLHVFGEDGSLVAHDDDSGPQDFSGGGLFNPEIVLQAPESGKYSLMVDYLTDSTISITAAYRLFVERFEGVGSLPERRSRLDETSAAEQRFTLTDGLDTRTFVFDHKGNGGVEITLDDCGDAEMAVAGLFDGFSERDENDELPRSVRLTADEAFSSFVTVSWFGQDSVECRLHSNAVLVEYVDEDGAELRFRGEGNAQYEGEFDYFGDYDYYIIELSRGDTLSVWVDSRDADTGLILLDHEGNVVADDDDSGPQGLWNRDHNPEIVYQATASGEYIVAVGYSPSTSSSTVGTYTLIAGRNN